MSLQPAREEMRPRSRQESVSPPLRTDLILRDGRVVVLRPIRAERAIVVRDDYQRKGLGTAILGRLSDIALTHGVRCLAGEILAEDEEMIGLLRANGVEIGSPRGGILRVATTSGDSTLGATTPAGGDRCANAPA